MKNSRMYYTSSSGELRKVRQICFLHALVHVRNLEWEYCHGARKTGSMYRCLQHEVSPESQKSAVTLFSDNFFFHVPLISLSMLPSRKHTDQILHAFVLGHVKHGNRKAYMVNLHMTITLLQQCWPVLFDLYLHFSSLRCFKANPRYLFFILK